ncbi:MAG: DUF1501 domain-containing protein, partial [Phycisphaerae bacterium]
MLGSIALSWLSQTSGLAAKPSEGSSSHSEVLHGAAIRQGSRIERVICLFQNGGPSQMDLFDPKPELNRLSGKPYPGSQKVETLSPSSSG